MDFKLNINGMNNNKPWEDPGQHKKRLKKKPPELDVNAIEDNVENGNNKFKENLNDLQEYVTSAQDKINILEMANETLNDISLNLNDIRDKALETIDDLESYEISTELKHKLENISKLETINKSFDTVQDDNDKNYTQIIAEFKKISHTTIRLAKPRGLKVI